MPNSSLRLLCAFLLVGCAALPAEIPEDENDDPWDGELTNELAVGGRYIPPANVRAAGERQYVAYDGAPSWSGGRNCSGTFGSGTRRLGEYLVANTGASRFDGYSCRQNTANTSKTSMHGTGRAIDLFVRLSGGAADNTVGDPIANWLIEHAEEIGVQYIIWDRTKWNGSYSGRKDRSYGGPHPHHDHLHIELTRAGARGDTPWFSSGSAPPGSGSPSTPSTPSEPGGSTSPHVGTRCGGSGSCIDTNTMNCEGRIEVGLCPGGNNIRCCIPSATSPTPEPTPSDPGPSDPPPGSGGLCSNTCAWANDGECDDGGPGSLYDVCDYGTDCGDCGTR